VTWRAQLPHVMPVTASSVAGLFTSKGIACLRTLGANRRGVKRGCYAPMCIRRNAPFSPGWAVVFYQNDVIAGGA
jgi:hypothetical protein